MPSTYWSIESSRERSPSAAAWRRRLMVKVLVTLPIRWCTSGVIVSSEVRSATPRARTHAYSAVWTAATTPGAPLSEKDCSNAASRASSGACPLSPIVIVIACSVSSVVVVSSAESSWLPPPPATATHQHSRQQGQEKPPQPPLLVHTTSEHPPPLPVDHRYGGTERNLA